MARARKKPRIPPTITSVGLWPCTSLTPLNWISRREESSFPRRLRARACWPAARRTPIASLTTTRAKQSERMKMLEFGPSVSAIAVVIDTTRALWLEGMPPVFQKKVTRTSRSDFERERRMLITDFRNCAVRRLHIAERKMGLLKMSAPAGRALTLTSASFPEGRSNVKARL